MQGGNPVIVVAVVEAVPLKRATTLVVAGKSEKECGSIQAMPCPELGQLFGRSLITERREPFGLEQMAVRLIELLLELVFGRKTPGYQVTDVLAWLGSRRRDVERRRPSGS